MVDDVDRTWLRQPTLANVPSTPRVRTVKKVRLWFLSPQLDNCSYFNAQGVLVLVILVRIMPLVEKSTVDINVSVPQEQQAPTAKLVSFILCFIFGDCGTRSDHLRSRVSSLLGDPCATNNCLNGGQCRPNGFGGFTCICTSGYTGQRCEERTFLVLCAHAATPPLFLFLRSGSLC